MILFIYDYLIQLDTLAPIIKFIKDKNRKIILLSTNPLHDYNKNSLVEYLKFNKIKLNAEIKKTNLASINCFLKTGFCFLKSKNNYNFYQKSSG